MERERGATPRPLTPLLPPPCGAREAGAAAEEAGEVRLGAEAAFLRDLGDGRVCSHEPSLDNPSGV